MKKVIRLTEDDLTRLVRRVIKEQSEKSVYKTATKVDESCLIQGGFKKKMVGGPMTKSEVYQKSINGKTHQLNVDGYARIIENDEMESIGKWVCDMSSPHKVKFLNLRSRRIMPM